MGGKKGAVLLVTLWLVAILSLLAIGIGFRTTIDLKLVGYQIDSIKAYEIAKAGVITAINELTNDESPDIDTVWECGITLKPNETFEGKFRGVSVGEGFFDISYIEDVQAKIGINSAPRDVLVGLFSGAANAGQIADNIRAWRGDTGSPTVPDEAKDYSDKPYACKGAPFDAVSELLLVKDMAEEIYYGKDEASGIEGLVTVFGPKDQAEFKININTASQGVLEALFESAGFDRSVAGKIVTDRPGPDGDIMKKEDNIFCQSEDPQALQQFIITAAGASYGGTTQEAEALTRLCNWLAIKAGWFKICSVGTLAGRKSNIYRTITYVVKRETAARPPHETEIVGWIEE